MVQAPGQVQRGSGEGSEGSEQVREVSVEVLGPLVQHQVTFQKVPEKVWQVLAESQFRFDRVPVKVPEKVPGGFGAEPSHVQQGPGEGSGEGLAGFGKIVKIERCGCGSSHFFPRGVS